MSQPTITRYFTRDHEWIAIDGEPAAGALATVGITDFAQSKLGDITFVELPEVGRVLAKGEGAVVVDSVKAAADVYAPASGTVQAVNPTLADAPEEINRAADSEGWLFRLTLAKPEELAGLMDATAYAAYIAEL